MKKLLSYFVPFTTKVESDKSGTLEINWIDGNKVLDSKNANYSFGSLQEVLTFGLSELDIAPNDKILLLGMGAGSILHTLRNKFKCSGHITGVEFDEQVIELAKSEFDLLKITDLEVIQFDAMEYVNQCKEKYDLIIIDLFIDDQVPDVFYSLDFWSCIVGLMEPKANILFNAGINLKDNHKYVQIAESLKTNISFEILQSVRGINTLLIGKAVSVS